MFPLLETAIGFVAIMLMISLLVKSLTELIKDHFDFYCDNLYYEADQFLRSVVNKSLSELKADRVVLARAPWLEDFDLSRMGDEFFNEDNIKPLLLSIKPDLDENVLQNVKGLVAAHVSRVKYMFQQRLKNLSFAVGVGLCLLLDINAVTIWRTLYTNDQVRTAFASEAATSALLNEKTAEQRAAALKVGQQAAEHKAAGQEAAARTAEEKPATGHALDAGDHTEAAKADEDAGQKALAAREAELAEARSQFGERVRTFTSEVNFGVGRVWRQNPPMKPRVSWIYEFLGALMTGLLVSVGAPYWHDILESFGSLRKDSKA